MTTEQRQRAQIDMGLAFLRERHREMLSTAKPRIKQIQRAAKLKRFIETQERKLA